MELSTLSFPHAYQRISRNEEVFCRSSSGLVAETGSKLRSRAVVSAGRDVLGYAPFCSVKDEGCGFCSHCRNLGFPDCGLDGRCLRRRREEAGCWKRREWRCLSVDPDANGSSESSLGSVHFVGIGGSGLSALALLALRQVCQSL